MILRLLWQSWRESWKILLLPVVMGVLCIALSWVFGAIQLWAGYSLDNWVFFATMFFAPALFGALAFSADQRRGHVRFLAEHAARPRYVWLSRHMLWLGTLVALAMALSIGLSGLILWLWHDHTAINLQRELQNSRPSYYPHYYILLDMRDGFSVATAATALAWCGMLTAYSIGQFCSMLLRSEILAAFLALVLAVVLSAWVAVLFVWQLSSLLFLLPLAAGLMLATWLRAPDWIAGRNSWRAWWKPALAVVAVLGLLGVMLPTERLAQIRRAPDPLNGRSGPAAITPESVALLKKRKAEAEATADLYLKAATMLNAPMDDDPLAPWSGPEYSESGVNGSIGGIDEGKIPAEQLKAFLAAKRKLEDQWFEQREAAVKLAIEASQRPTCQFAFQLSFADGSIRYRSSRKAWSRERHMKLSANCSTPWFLIQVPSANQGHRSSSCWPACG